MGLAWPFKVGSCRLDVAEAFGSAAKVVPGEIIFITDRQDSYREIGPLVRLEQLFHLSSVCPPPSGTTDSAIQCGRSAGEVLQ